jgi:peptide/nickel transport system substrate-binding protein
LCYRWLTTDGKESVEPAEPLKRIIQLVDTARGTGRNGQVQAAQKLFRIWADNVYEIGAVGLTPMVKGGVVINGKMHNVPNTLGNDWPLRSPGNAHTELVLLHQVTPADRASGTTSRFACPRGSAGIW